MEYLSNSMDWLELRLVKEALRDVVTDCNEDLSEVNFVRYVQGNMLGKQDMSLCAYIILSKWCAWQINMDKNVEWFRLRFFW